MKTFKNRAAQGDVMFIRIDKLPEGVVKQEPTGTSSVGSPRYIVTHSETGHHHTMEATPTLEFYADPKDDMKSYLVVQGIIGDIIEHQRPYDTHESMLIPPGIFEVRRQREQTPEGWTRRVED